MTNTISIMSLLGNDLRTRLFFRRDIEKLVSCYGDNIELDFSKVLFVSRSVADEICNILQEYPLIRISGMTGDVKMMYDVVVRGRNSPREYSDVNAKVYHLGTIKEMREFFSTF